MTIDNRYLNGDKNAQDAANNYIAGQPVPTTDAAIITLNEDAIDVGIAASGKNKAGQSTCG